MRYRYDKKRHRRYKTVEIIIEEKDWYPGTISYPEKKAWHLSYRKVVELGLEKRLLDEELPF